MTEIERIELAGLLLEVGDLCRERDDVLFQQLSELCYIMRHILITTSPRGNARPIAPTHADTYIADNEE